MTYNEQIEQLAMKMARNPIYPKLATSDDIEHMNGLLLQRYRPLAVIAIDFAREMRIEAYHEGYLEAELGLGKDSIEEMAAHLITLGLSPDKTEEK